MLFNSERLTLPKIRQSVVRWTFQQFRLDELCKRVAEIGLNGVDVLSPNEFDIPPRYGLECSLAHVGLGDNKSIGLNRTEHHGGFEAAFRRQAPIAAKAGISRAIAFCGTRSKDLSDEVGARNCISCLTRLAPIAADNGITICLEPQNSKLDHPGYMCDRIDWAVGICEEVANANVKLLFDIYHAQLMEGNLIATIRKHAQWFAHYHTGGVPGRHEIGDEQEIYYPAVMQAIAESGFAGYIAHEFIPTTNNPFDGLRGAFDLCDAGLQPHIGSSRVI
jgi:hydroxypyruvate isomerase